MATIYARPPTLSDQSTEADSASMDLFDNNHQKNILVNHFYDF